MSVFNKKKQGVAQTGAYKIKVKNKPANFTPENTVLRLEISVGQSYHEGEKLRCTLEWAKHRFEKIIILVNDTLQRFNYMSELGLTEKDAYEKSFKDGTDWLARNMEAISVLPNFEIYRWDSWKNSEEYPQSLHQSRMLYNTNVEFKSAIDDAINEVLVRRSICEDQREQFFENSIYLYT